MVHPFILFFSFFFIKLNVKAKKAILSLLLSLPTNLSNVEIIFQDFAYDFETRILTLTQITISKPFSDPIEPKNDFYQKPSHSLLEAFNKVKQVFIQSPPSRFSCPFQRPLMLRLINHKSNILICKKCLILSKFTFLPGFHPIPIYIHTYINEYFRLGYL